VNDVVARADAPTDPTRVERVSRRVTHWMTAVALLPAPLWLLCAMLRDPGPAWRAQYFGNPDFAGGPFVRSERELGVRWDNRKPIPESSMNSDHGLSARWDTCLQLDEAREIPFQLVSEQAARFSIDGQEKLRLEDGRDRGARGDVFRLEAGVHRLLVETSSASRGNVALNASLDGRAPRALGPRSRMAGVKLRQPAPSDPVCR
jgi:hypothetical protein